MKISNTDLREMLNFNTASIEKEASASKDDFKKILDISKTDNKDSASSNVEGLSNNVEEVTDDNIVESSNEITNDQITAVDTSLLMNLMSLINYGESTDDKNLSLQSLREEINVSNMEALLGFSGKQEAKEILQGIISNKDSKTANDAISLLLKNNSVVESKELVSLLTEIKESVAPEIEAPLVNSVLKQVSQAIKDTASTEVIPTKVENFEANASVSNSIPANKNNLQGSLTESTSEDNQSNTGELEAKEDKILKSIINSDNKDETKLTPFSLHINRLRESATPVQNASETIIVNRNEMANDIVKVIKHMNSNDLKEITVKINPIELGEMTIRITIEGNLLKASISASNKDTYSLLNSNAADIKNSLNASQVKIQDVAIDIYNDDTTFFSNSFQRNGQQSGERGRRSPQSNRTSEPEEVVNLNIKDNKLDVDNNLSILA